MVRMGCHYWPEGQYSLEVQGPFSDEEYVTALHPKIYCATAFTFVGGFGLAPELEFHPYAPTSHAPVAGHVFGVPLQTTCTAVLTVCCVQIRLASCFGNPAGHTEVRFAPAPTVGDEPLVGE
jgi:hypothetical protein